jgi:hypothetical protein
MSIDPLRFHGVEVPDFYRRWRRLSQMKQPRTWKGCSGVGSVSGDSSAIRVAKFRFSARKGMGDRCPETLYYKPLVSCIMCMLTTHYPHASQCANFCGNPKRKPSWPQKGTKTNCLLLIETHEPIFRAEAQWSGEPSGVASLRDAARLPLDASPYPMKMVFCRRLLRYIYPCIMHTCCAIFKHDD